jgi:hypothetical protein
MPVISDIHAVSRLVSAFLSGTIFGIMIVVSVAGYVKYTTPRTAPIRTSYRASLLRHERVVCNVEY